MTHDSDRRPEKTPDPFASCKVFVMQLPVVLPDLGVEPVTELVVSIWFADEGDEVLEGDRLVEILAGAVTFDVSAPATGKLIELRAVEDDVVRAGDVLGVVEADESETTDTHGD